MYLFLISLIDHLDALTPLPEQQGPTVSTSHLLEDFNEVQIAFYLTYYSWSLYNNVSEVGQSLSLFAAN